MNPASATFCLLLLVLPASLHSHEGLLRGLLQTSPVDGKAVLTVSPLNVTVRLRRVRSLVSPRYSLVVRNGSRVSVDRGHPLPSCLFEGSYAGPAHKITASVSTCTDQALSTLEVNGVHYTLESETRTRRTAADAANQDEVLILREPGLGQECGLNKRNKKRLRVEERRPVLRLKRDTAAISPHQRYIELAVFVDDRMYSSVESTKKAGESTLQKIQDIVFAYLNAVQIIYQSERLSNKLRLVLVRLDVMQVPDSSLDSKEGEIESYLDAFCTWQRDKNPSSHLNNADLVDEEHWDHALLLTGYNLYDTSPDRDSVIGLAWVSGMCHPDYSCTINEGNNFESVYVIAHEMGHNLGMNHDGESLEGNTCSPDDYLMSPILGPGKVSWSACSDTELNTFLNDAKTRSQASCLEDLPAGVLRYDFSLGGKKPGDKFPAIDQCRQAFGPYFNPYMKEEAPFEDLCRELWCSNLTHALRAHPALEGTDCSSKPFPYGSVCVEGVCSPFTPPDAVEATAQPIESGPGATTERPAATATNPTTRATTSSYPNPELNFIDDTPAWYDPIYTQVFTSLRKSFEEAHPILFLSQTTKDGRAAQMAADQPPPVLLADPATSSLHNLSLAEVANNSATAAVWQLEVDECPVECGGAWAGVRHLCQLSGLAVDQAYCHQKKRPAVSKLPCGTRPCTRRTGPPSGQPTTP